MRLISGKLSVHGSLRIFTLYKGTESGGINDYETKILLNGGTTNLNLFLKVTVLPGTYFT